jgi:hypothetical protein
MDRERPTTDRRHLLRVARGVALASFIGAIATNDETARLILSLIAAVGFACCVGASRAPP